MKLKIQMSEQEIKTVLAVHIANTLTAYTVTNIELTRKRNDGVVADLIVEDAPPQMAA
jgi:hypothetical protein